LVVCISEPVTRFLENIELPTVQCCVVNVNTTLSHNLLKISIRNSKTDMKVDSIEDHAFRGNELLWNQSTSLFASINYAVDPKLALET